MGSLARSASRKRARVKDPGMPLPTLPKLASDWLLVEVLDAKARGTNEQVTPGGIVVPATVRFVGLRHCRVLLAGPGLVNDRGVLIETPVKVGDYILIAGEDLVAEIETHMLAMKGHFAMARSVVAYGPDPIQ